MLESLQAGGLRRAWKKRGLDQSPTDMGLRSHCALDIAVIEFMPDRERED